MEDCKTPHQPHSSPTAPASPPPISLQLQRFSRTERKVHLTAIGDMEPGGRMRRTGTHARRQGRRWTRGGSDNPPARRQSTSLRAGSCGSPHRCPPRIVMRCFVSCACACVRACGGESGGELLSWQHYYRLSPLPLLNPSLPPLLYSFSSLSLLYLVAARSENKQTTNQSNTN